MPSIWQAIADEPLIPFALVGSLLFVVFGFREPDGMAETIEVKPATIRALESSREELLGRSLTDEERQNLVEGYIEDEVLMREAFRMNLEKKDSRVRKRLLDVMRSTLDQEVAQPTRAQLQAYFRENPEQYATGETIMFDHVFFAFGSESDPADPDALLATLRGGADHEQLGDYTFFGSIMRDRSKDQLRQMLGSEFSEQAFGMPLGVWHGPVESRHGVHFIRVIEKRENPPPVFEQLEEYLLQDWMFRKRLQIQSDKIAELQKRYRIVYVKEQ